LPSQLPTIKLLFVAILSHSVFVLIYVEKNAGSLTLVTAVIGAVWARSMCCVAPGYRLLVVC
jgi:hypothetical protein